MNSIYFHPTIKNPQTLCPYFTLKSDQKSEQIFDEKTSYRWSSSYANFIRANFIDAIFKNIHKYLPFANFWLFISLVQFFGQKIALMKKIAKNSHNANCSNETNSQKIALAKYLANT